MTEVRRTALPSAPVTSGTGTFPMSCPDALRAQGQGPFDPEQGRRVQPHKLLLDPYAKPIPGVVDWKQAHLPYMTSAEKPDLRKRTILTAPVRPEGCGRRRRFDWGDDHPRTPWPQADDLRGARKGFTQSSTPTSPERFGARTPGSRTAAVIDHLQALGVTAVELLPVHQFVDDEHFVERAAQLLGLQLARLLRAQLRYSAGATGPQVSEFKEMVKTCTPAGIEVILDVVYNHTAEGNHLGPTLSFRGIDNPAYYRSCPTSRATTWTTPACGNSLNVRHPRVLQLIMDSLRYWVTEMHVDGFRFDLAAALARELHEVDRLSRVLRHHPSGPGALAGEADRRAVGPRRGRLPGRQLPARLGRVERQVSRHVRVSGRATAAGSPSSLPR